MLEDVSCLWGLPITGVPVTGSTNRANAKGWLFELLGIKVYEQLKFMKKKIGAEGNEKYIDWTMLKSKIR